VEFWERMGEACDEARRQVPVRNADSASTASRCTCRFAERS
jgi:hypothetical protein